MDNQTYDFLAIGLGPFNLGLACLTEPLDDLNGIFLEKNDTFNWHPGMMIEGTHLQTPFMSDLVTLADPTHPLSFLNYIKQQGRIYSFYIKESFFLMRQEYNQYCQWATQQLSNIRFSTQVQQITFDENAQLYEVTATNTRTGITSTFCTRKLVLGTGPSPYLPDAVADLTCSVNHSSSYLDNKRDLQSKPSITIVGSGQSAAEIFYDLLQEIDAYGYQLNWVTRSPRFFPLEYSKLTLEMTSPEYVEYFYHLPQSKRDQLIAQQKQLYKGINTSLINEIYNLLYIKNLNEKVNVQLLTNNALTHAQHNPQSGEVTLNLHQIEQDQHHKLTTHGLVMATGYQYQLPEFLQGISQQILWDDKGRFRVNRNYSIDKSGKTVFVQNAELHTHGFVTPDLGMAAYRNSYLIREISGVEHYPIESRIAFQQFAAPSPIAITREVSIK